MNLPALYTVVAEFREQAEQLADMELDEQTYMDSLESIQWPVEQKSRAVAAVIGNMDAETAMLESFIEVKKEQLKTRKARVASLREYLLRNMLDCNITEIKAIDGSMTIKVKQNPPSVLVEDESAIPWEYMRQAAPPPPAVDKAAIKEAIKNGIDVPGARLVSKQSVSIK
jgi:hypothetical protein